MLGARLGRRLRKLAHRIQTALKADSVQRHIVRDGGFSHQAPGPVAALVAAASRRTAASDRAERPVSHLGFSEAVAESGRSGVEVDLSATAPGLAGPVWLPGAGGGNLRGSRTLSGDLLQSGRLATIGTDRRICPRLAGLLYRHPACSLAIFLFKKQSKAKGGKKSLPDFEDHVHRKPEGLIRRFTQRRSEE